MRAVATKETILKTIRPTHPFYIKKVTVPCSEMKSIYNIPVCTDNFQKINIMPYLWFKGESNL